MSYGADYANLFRRAGDYVDKILREAKPADLPVEQPTKFEFFINLKSAKALGLESRRPCSPAPTFGDDRLQVAPCGSSEVWTDTSTHFSSRVSHDSRSG